MKVLLLLLLIFSQDLFAEKQRRYWKTKKDGLYNRPVELYDLKAENLEWKSSQWSWNTSSFLSTNRMNKNGLETPFGDGEAFSMINSEFDLRYGFRKTLQIHLGGRYRNVSNTVNSTDDDGLETNTEHTNGNFESYHVGFQWEFPRTRWWYYSLYFDYRNTAYTNSEATATEEPGMVLGDQGPEYKIGGHIGIKRTKNHYLSFSGIYNSPGGHLSDEISYQAEMAWPYISWCFYGGLEGIYSLNNSIYDDNPANRPDYFTGSTYLFNSVNREWFRPYFGVNYGNGRLRLGLKFAYSLFGKSTDLGYEGALNLTWTTRGLNNDHLKVEEFKEYNVEATIVKVSRREMFLKIDEGVTGDVVRGMTFDIYQADFFGTNVLIASAIVYRVGSNWAILKLTKKYKAVRLKPGFIARAN